MYRVLVTEPLAQPGLDLLRQHAEVDVVQKPSSARLAELVSAYDALVVRSHTRVTSQVVESGERLRVIGRAGTGVDNIDLESATRHGVLVVNAPNGNSVAVAEHTIGLMLALARHIPQGDSSLRQGRWAKGALMGTEVKGKCLGIVGMGRVGTAVAKRAIGMEMEVVAYDPFVSTEHAARLNVRLMPLEELLRAADFVSLHVPATDLTRGIIGARELALMKPTARLINCARGGLLDEDALLEALQEGRIAGAALDVFSQEPLEDSRFFDQARLILTPHLGASTEEAQCSAALDVAEQVISVLQGRVPRYPVNAPALSPEELAEVGPYVDLAQRLGSLYAQMATGNLVGLELAYAGELAGHDTQLLKAAALTGLLSHTCDEMVNLINAEMVARERGILLSERRVPTAENFTSLLTLKAATSVGERALVGTVMRGQPHLVAIDGFWLDFILDGLLLISEHIEQPGIIGRMGLLLGEADVNISFVQVGRRERGGHGVMVVGVDDSISEELLGRIMTLPSIRAAWLVVI